MVSSDPSGSTASASSAVLRLSERKAGSPSTGCEGASGVSKRAMRTIPSKLTQMRPCASVAMPSLSPIQPGGSGLPRVSRSCDVPATVSSRMRPWLSR